MVEKQKPIVVGLGEILWDMLPDGRQLGGAPTNFAYHAQALGAAGIVASCIGNDNLGKDILTILKQLGLTCEYIVIDKHHPTGTVTVELDENGKPDYIIHKNVAWDFILSSPALLELAAKADAVCFGSLCQRNDVSRNTVRQFLQAVKSDCLRVFDINLRQSYYSVEVIEAMLELSNVLKLNNEELPVVSQLLGINGPQDKMLARLTSRYDLNLIVLTKGPNGSRLYTLDEDSICSGGDPVQIADTVGAGDCFTAVVTMGLLSKQTLDKINTKANRLAGFVCSQPGATPQLPRHLVEKI